MIGYLSNFLRQFSLNLLGVINSVIKDLQHIKHQHIRLPHLIIRTQDHLTADELFLFCQRVRVLNHAQLTKGVCFGLVDLL